MAYEYKLKCNLYFLAVPFFFTESKVDENRKKPRQSSTKRGTKKKQKPPKDEKKDRKTEEEGKMDQCTLAGSVPLLEIEIRKKITGNLSNHINSFPKMAW